MQPIWMHTRGAGHKAHATCTSLITCIERSLMDRLMRSLRELFCGGFVCSWVVQCDSKSSHGTWGKSASCSSNSYIPPLQNILGHLPFTTSLASRPIQLICRWIPKVMYQKNVMGIWLFARCQVIPFHGISFP